MTMANRNQTGEHRATLPHLKRDFESIVRTKIVCF